MSANNSADIIVKGPILQEREDGYPDPCTLPLPSQEPRIAEVTLFDLTPGNTSLLLQELCI
jgi:hypothetical protein